MMADVMSTPNELSTIRVRAVEKGELMSTRPPSPPRLTLVPEPKMPPAPATSRPAMSVSSEK